VSLNKDGISSYQSSSTINSNTVCGNTNLDFNSNSSGWLSSSGDNNTCNNSDGWNDTGTTGCTYCCDGSTTTTGCNQTGACSGAFKTCSAGNWGACSKLPTTEIQCNGIDEDCDGIDLCCHDNDNDGYKGITAQCPAPNGTDCDDNNNQINPKATEICNGKDDNCNGQTDEENATNCTIYYKDADNDGYGKINDSKCLCSPSGDYKVTIANDCDDNDANINPGVEELCGNKKDDNCNGQTDEAGCVNYCTCVNCSDCTNKLTDPACGEIRLKNNIAAKGSEICISFTKGSASANNKIFDCQNYAIKNTGNFSVGIYLTGSGFGNTVKNCKIQNFFQNGIYVNSSVNKIINNIILSNNNYGIYLDLGGIGNSFLDNILCGNTFYDFYNAGFEKYGMEWNRHNLGVNNTCSKPDGWNDINKTGCTYQCQECVNSQACSEGYYCSDGFCVPQKSDNEKCSNNEECKSKICDKGKCAANSSPLATNLQSTISDENYCGGIEYAPVTLSWTYSDPNNNPPGTDPQTKYQIQIDDNSDFSSPIFDTTTPGPATSRYINSQQIKLNKTYYWRVKVWDSHDASSSFTTASFKTPNHIYPEPVFSNEPLKITKNVTSTIVFDNKSICYKSEDPTPTTTCTSFEWNFGDGTSLTTTTATSVSHTYAPTSTSVTVELKATDSLGKTCSTSTELQTKRKRPIWREI